MHAIVFRRYGSPDVLEAAEVERPVPGDEDVLVRVMATSINPYDLHFLAGDPIVARPMLGLGLRTPRPTILGSDVAGVVEETGAKVAAFRPGDDVFGTAGFGGFGEFVTIRERGLARKPASASFAQAAAIPMAATTALQGLRDAGRLQPGQTVLVNGASGGVGSFAVQIAKALGAADVTGVCGASNVEAVRSLGADRVIDYTAEDFTRSDSRYDVLLDAVGNHSARAFCRAVTPQGTFVVVGGGGGRILGPIAQLLSAKLLSPFVSQRVATFVARSSGEDLAFIAGLVEAGRVTPLIDRTYGLAEAAEALRRLATRHARGKIVIAVGQ